MKKTLAILGSTGSIGRSLLKIIDKDKKNLKILLLTANKDYKTLINQARKFNVKKIIITNKDSYEIAKKKYLKSSIKIFNSFNNLKKIIGKKIDYTMSSIIGIEGLDPTLKIIKFTKIIAIANKESIVCGWNLINKELLKSNTKFIPVDSEHFSLWYAINNTKYNKIENFFLTASGGPFYNKPLKNFKNIKISEALNHPNWRMGKKISIDSATMINKVYEVIEAKNIFDIPYKKIDILIHPKSYVHSVIKFNNGMIKVIAHDTTMDIPIFNTLYLNSDQKIISKKINIEALNNLDFKKVSIKRYPMIKLLKKLPNKSSLFETIIVSANDTLVNLFLSKKIKFTDIQKKLFKIINYKEFSKYKKISPKNVKDILYLNDYVRLKINEKSV